MVHCKRAAMPCFQVNFGSIFLTKAGGSRSVQFISSLKIDKHGFTTKREEYMKEILKKGKTFC